MSRFWQILLGICGLLILANVFFSIIVSPQMNHGNVLRTGCVSKQYSQDYNAVLPPGAAANSNGWREAVYPYVKSTGVYRCPEDERDRSKDASKSSA